MAANLTLQYYKAEEAFRRAQSTEDRISTLREMLRVIPKHKGTDHLQGALRSRLSELQRQYRDERQTSKHGRSYRIPRQGCGTVIVLGPPNSGKSRLVAELTNATPEVADYPYTTREPVPGILSCEDVRIQLIDTPAMTESTLEPYLVDFVRTADLVLCCIDGRNPQSLTEVSGLLEQLRQRKTVLDRCSGFDETDFSIVHVKTMVVVTHGRAVGDTVFRSQRQLLFPNDVLTVNVELSDASDRERLGRTIFQALEKIRVYTQRPGTAVEMRDPYVMAAGETVADLAGYIHEDIARSLKSAKVWRGDQQSPVVVGRDYVLEDGDIVELRTSFKPAR